MKAPFVSLPTFSNPILKIDKENCNALTLLTLFSPLMDAEGRPFQPKRVQEIIQERYYISKYMHTSYVDVGLITPQERECLLGIINKEKEIESKAIDEINKKQQNK